MLLQNILGGLDLTKIKMVRHNLSSVVVANNYSHGYIDIYQRIQTPKCFRECEYILSFLGEKGTEGKFLGCYKVNGSSTFAPELLPVDFLQEEKMHPDNHVFWNLEKTDVLSELIGRLTIDWGKSRGFDHWASTKKEVLYILPVAPSVADIIFASYDRVLLSFDDLKTIVNNNKSHKVWEDKLSAVAGIYLITDIKTGRQYVGSARSEQGGIWGRWRDYARTKHGGNKRLKELIAADVDYCNNFQFSILEVFPIKRESDVLEYEALYKMKLRTIEFGLNDN